MTTKDIRVLYGAKLKDFRKKKGLSQEELGFKSSLHRTYISEVERGRRNISIMNIDRIAKALNLRAKDFFD
jgi:transcriptional regulator with XRE-family HTH domain